MADRWVQFVRDAAELSMELPSDDEIETVTISPHFFPPPKNLPARISKEDAMSVYWIEDRKGKRVYVPKRFIMRDHKMAPVEPTKYWIDSAPHPCDVIVLAAPNCDHIHEFGWYLRHTSAPRKLVRMAERSIHDLLKALDRVAGMAESSLKTKYIDALILAFYKVDVDCPYLATQHDCPSQFHHNALKAFRNYELSLDSPAGVCKKRRRHAALENLNNRSRSGTCCICLEDDVVLYDSRCCGKTGAMCDDCMRSIRCLCPICDRTIINAQYACTACGTSMSLTDYGFPCGSCNECTLCKNCYEGRVECGDCDCQRAASRPSKADVFV